MPTQPLPGFRDFYPDDLTLRAHIFRTWRNVAARYGFEEYDGPPLEPLELYTAKSGAEIVGQLYTFTDKGGREVALRPEMTPTLARMVAARANGLRKPIRWFSIPQLFRYERQQRGRLREHFQLNCDLIGEPGPLGDAELIALALDVMRDFGLTEREVRVRVSDRRVLAALLQAGDVPEARLSDAYQVIDKSERAKRSELEARLSAAGLSARAVDTVFRVAGLQGWPAVAAELDRSPVTAAARAPLARTIEALEAMGLGPYVEVDLTIVRGLAYYTGTVFELFDAGRKMRAICGGGRYDDLLQVLGGVDLPALGFGMGDVVLADLLREHGVAPDLPGKLDVFLSAVTADDIPAVLALAHELRDAGLRCEYALSAQPVGKQLKLADSRGAAHAVIIGPDDRAAGQVQLKDLASGGAGQEAVARGRIVRQLSGRDVDRRAAKPAEGSDGW